MEHSYQNNEIDGRRGNDTPHLNDMVNALDEVFTLACRKKHLG